MFNKIYQKETRLPDIKINKYWERTAIVIVVKEMVSPYFLMYFPVYGNLQFPRLSTDLGISISLGRHGGGYGTVASTPNGQQGQQCQERSLQVKTGNTIAIPGT